MKKITFTIIFMVLIIPLFLVNVHGQTLQVDANLGDMREIEVEEQEGGVNSPVYG